MQTVLTLEERKALANLNMKETLPEDEMEASENRIEEFGGAQSAGTRKENCVFGWKVRFQVLQNTIWRLHPERKGVDCP